MINLKKNFVTARAFTLVELLVVVAIISVLVSVLMPSLSGTRDLARNMACMSNLRGISLAEVAYTNDNNGFLANDVATVGYHEDFFADHQRYIIRVNDAENASNPEGWVNYVLLL